MCPFQNPVPSPFHFSLLLYLVTCHREVATVHSIFVLLLLPPLLPSLKPHLANIVKAWIFLSFRCRYSARKPLHWIGIALCCNTTPDCTVHNSTQARLSFKLLHPLVHHSRLHRACIDEGIRSSFTFSAQPQLKIVWSLSLSIYEFFCFFFSLSSEL